MHLTLFKEPMKEPAFHCFTSPADPNLTFIDVCKRAEVGDRIFFADKQFTAVYVAKQLQMVGFEVKRTGSNYFTVIAINEKQRHNAVKSDVHQRIDQLKEEIRKLKKLVKAA